MVEGKLKLTGVDDEKIGAVVPNTEYVVGAVVKNGVVVGEDCDENEAGVELVGTAGVAVEGGGVSIGIVGVAEAVEGATSIAGG